MAVKRGLGRGLGALLGNTEDEYEKYDKEPVERPEKKKSVEVPQKSGGAGAETDSTMELPLDLIDPNVNQPRKKFDEVAMSDLTNSIRMHGVISPIIVVKSGERYMIIAGERRYRASKQAGLKVIPAIVRDYTQKQVKEISLIENLQREDLNPIETANAIKQLMDEYRYTQEEVADRINKSRPAVANTLRLLSLSNPVIGLVAGGKLSSGHARCLVVVSDPEVQLRLAMEGLDNKISVRDFEKKIKAFLKPKDDKKPPTQSIELKELLVRMQRVFSTKVSSIGNDQKGRIYIDYYNRDDLDRFVDLVARLEKKDG